MSNELLPRFNELLGAAHEASEAVDDFDLHSESKESVEEWKKLVEEQTNTQTALIEFIREHPEQLIAILQKTRRPS